VTGTDETTTTKTKKEHPHPMNEEYKIKIDFSLEELRELRNGLAATSAAIYEDLEDRENLPPLRIAALEDRIRRVDTLWHRVYLIYQTNEQDPWQDPA
jgi:hypothetical protein